MPFVAIITVLALVQFFWLALRVARARARYGVAAPATSGHEVFERHFRVQMNTQEQLLLFLPSLWIFASYISPLWAAILGLVFLAGRTIYAISYVREPNSRAAGFALTVLPSFVMMFGILIWAVRAVVITGFATG